MSNKKYALLNYEGNNEYNLVVEENTNGSKLSLYTSNNEVCWNSQHRDKLVLEMIDDGNGVKLSKKNKKMDYGELECLRILINFNHKTDKYELNRHEFTVAEHLDLKL
jgi:hypothetical protein